MKRGFIMLAVALILIAPPAWSDVSGKEVEYLGGTVAGVSENTRGHFITTDARCFIFEFGERRIEIPYARMQNVSYEKKLARRLGALSAVPIIMVKHRQRRHYLTVVFNDDAGVAQTAVFEISKQAPATLLPILKTRCPACFPRQQANPVYFTPGGSPRAFPVTPPPAPPAAQSAAATRPSAAAKPAEKP
jgi:hypothetical protein